MDIVSISNAVVVRCGVFDLLDPQKSKMNVVREIKPNTVDLILEQSTKYTGKLRTNWFATKTANVMQILTPFQSLCFELDKLASGVRKVDDSYMQKNR